MWWWCVVVVLVCCGVGVWWCVVVVVKRRAALHWGKMKTKMGAKERVPQTGRRNRLLRRRAWVIKPRGLSTPACLSCCRNKNKNKTPHWFLMLYDPILPRTSCFPLLQCTRPELPQQNFHSPILSSPPLPTTLPFLPNPFCQRAIWEASCSARVTIIIPIIWCNTGR